MLQIGQEVRPNAVLPTGAAPGAESLQYGQVSQNAPAKIKGTKMGADGQLYYDIDQTYIGGGTGFVKASALEAALGGGQPAANPNVAATSTAPASGINIAGMNLSTPTLNVQSLYDNAFKEAGITDIEKKSTDTQAEIDKRQKALADAKAIINENPFYSEATRVGRIRRLEEQAQTDIGNLTNQKALYENQIAQKKADVQNKLNLQLKQSDIDRQAKADGLNQFNSLLASGALTYAASGDIATLAAQTGIPTSLINSAIQKAKAAEVKPQIITSTDNSGNVTYAVIDPATGNIIKKQSLGAIGAAATGKAATEGDKKSAYMTQIEANLRAVSGSDGFVSPGDYAAAVSDAVRAGYTVDQAVAILDKYRNRNNKNYYIPGGG